MKYNVLFTYTKVKEDVIEASSVDEAKEKWEEDLKFISTYTDDNKKTIVGSFARSI